MTESKVLAPSSSTAEPQVLANVRPTPGQRRTARAFLLALLVVLLGTWPIAAIKLPEVDAFVPTLAAALFVSDCVTAAAIRPVLHFASVGTPGYCERLPVQCPDRGCACAGLPGSVHTEGRPGLRAAIRRGSTGFGMQGCPSRSLATPCSRTQIISPTSASRNAP